MCSGKGPQPLLEWVLCACRVLPGRCPQTTGYREEQAPRRQHQRHVQGCRCEWSTSAKGHGHLVFLVSSCSGLRRNPLTGRPIGIYLECELCHPHPQSPLVPHPCSWRGFLSSRTEPFSSLFGLCSSLELGNGVLVLVLWSLFMGISSGTLCLGVVCSHIRGEVRVISLLSAGDRAPMPHSLEEGIRQKDLCLSFHFWGPVPSALNRELAEGRTHHLLFEGQDRYSHQHPGAFHVARTGIPHSGRV